MATKNVTYQFEWGFSSYNRQTEADRIAEIEAADNYIKKFDITIPEREIIDEGAALLEVINGELVITEVGNIDIMSAENWIGDDD